MIFQLCWIGMVNRLTTSGWHSLTSSSPFPWCARSPCRSGARFTSATTTTLRKTSEEATRAKIWLLTPYKVPSNSQTSCNTVSFSLAESYETSYHNNKTIKTLNKCFASYKHHTTYDISTYSMTYQLLLYMQVHLSLKCLKMINYINLSSHKYLRTNQRRWVLQLRISTLQT